MTIDRQTGPLAVSVILPANNEVALIGDCLLALLASDPVPGGVQVVVVANGCSDDTALVARAFAAQFTSREWELVVLDLAEGGKPGALNAGDAAATGRVRVYLDADVTVAPGLLAQLLQVLDVAQPRYASGTLVITAKGWVSRAYARIWRQVPFMRQGVPGCGVFAMNAAGRARWGDFPPIISDDTFARLQFAPVERVSVSAPYDWPIAEGLRALIKVRRRQDAGVDEIAHLYPDLPKNDDKAPFPVSEKLSLAIRDPLGFAIYTGVAIASKLTRHKAQGWSRSR
ncbi:glycosyltransferase [Tropicibacter naphthalenivorans]|nr:glycosyltransferase [Tropicibacter naphthalenivorans]